VPGRARTHQVRHVALALGVVATAPIVALVEPLLNVHDDQSGASGHGLRLTAAAEHGVNEAAPALKTAPGPTVKAEGC
jgi:hypothetical protein